MADCSDLRTVLQRAVTGAPVADEELAVALRHAARCPRCAPLLEAARDVAGMHFDESLAGYAAALRAGEDAASQWPAFAEHVTSCERCQAVVDALVAVDAPLPQPEPERTDPAELFERALAGGLADPETITRERAALRLGERASLEPGTLTALADAAVRDPEPRVRTAALAALERVDGRESLADRIVGWWRGTTAEASRDLAAALARVARTAQAPWLGVSPVERLALRSALRGPRSLRVVGEEGVDGRLDEVEGELWLSLSGLPPRYEGERLTIAVPGALGPAPPAVRWPGAVPGLVEGDTPVSGGSMRVRLGEAAAPATAEHEALVEILLLRSHRPGAGLSGGPP